MDYAIILGGGKGLRMGATLPKQFLEIGGRPILMHTIDRFRQYAAQSGRPLQIIVVLPHEQQTFWHDLCQKHHFQSPTLTADGGQTRFHSIKNAIALIPSDAQGVVAVHDGVRPFPDVEVIDRVIQAARTDGAAIPVVPVIETLRQIDSNTPHTGTITSHTVPRDNYCLVQTPQAFSIALHRQAYEQPYTDTFTDDASVVEATGQSITLVQGNRENIKITTPFDMTVAEAIYEKQPF